MLPIIELLARPLKLVIVVSKSIRELRFTSKQHIKFIVRGCEYGDLWFDATKNVVRHIYLSFRVDVFDSGSWKKNGEIHYRWLKTEEGGYYEEYT